jgi:hypothetical protein
VEQYYISSGFLIPSFHKHYWLGLTTQKQGGRPNWYWLEPNAGSPQEDEVYKHWGMYQVRGWAGRQGEHACKTCMHACSSDSTGPAQVHAT